MVVVRQNLQHGQAFAQSTFVGFGQPTQFLQQAHQLLMHCAFEETSAILLPLVATVWCPCSEICRWIWPEFC